MLGSFLLAQTDTRCGRWISTPSTSRQHRRHLRCRTFASRRTILFPAGLLGDGSDDDDGAWGAFQDGLRGAAEQEIVEGRVTVRPDHKVGGIPFRGFGQKLDGRLAAAHDDGGGNGAGLEFRLQRGEACAHGAFVGDGDLADARRRRGEFFQVDRLDEHGDEHEAGVEGSGEAGGFLDDAWADGGEIDGGEDGLLGGSVAPAEGNTMGESGRRVSWAEFRRARRGRENTY